MAVIDQTTGYLPKKLSWGTFGAVSMALGWVVLSRTSWQSVTQLIFAPIAAALAAGAFYLSWKLTKLGFGDVRLAALIGLVSGSVGLNACLAALLVGSGLGVLQGVLRAIRHQKGGYPFGPALVFGCFCSAPISALLLS